MNPVYRINYPEDEEYTAPSLWAAKTYARQRAAKGVSLVPPQPETLLIPRDHEAVLFADPLGRANYRPPWSLNSPVSYGEAGRVPDPYLVDVEGSGFPSPWAPGDSFRGVLCRAPEGVPSKYDREHSGNLGHGRTGLYRGYRYPVNVYTVTYLDFRLQDNQAEVFPWDVGPRGGAQHYYSQLLQLKTWEGEGEADAEFFHVSMGRNGIKSDFAEARSGDEWYHELEPGRWYRLGIEVPWSVDATWIRLWLNDEDPSVMREVAHEQIAARHLMTPRGATYLCFGPYLTWGNYEGDIETAYAHPCVWRLRGSV